MRPRKPGGSRLSGSWLTSPRRTPGRLAAASMKRRVASRKKGATKITAGMGAAVYRRLHGPRQGLCFAARWRLFRVNHRSLPTTDPREPPKGGEGQEKHGPATHLFCQL